MDKTMESEMIPAKDVNAYIVNINNRFYLKDGDTTSFLNNPFILQVGKKKFKRVTFKEK